MDGKDSALTAPPVRDCRPESLRGTILSLAAGLAVVVIAVKLTLLPCDVSTTSEFFRYLLRLALVCSADLCFVAVMALGCWVVSVIVARWTRLQVAYRRAVFALYYFACVYAVLSVPMYQICLAPFTIRLLSFAGGPMLMSSSIAQFVTAALAASLICVPVGLMFLPCVMKRAPWFRSGAPIRVPLALVVGLTVAFYGYASQAYIESHWTEPARWERRISQSPHAALVGSCVEELLKKEAFTSSIVLADVDDSDFRAREIEKNDDVVLPGALASQPPKNVIVLYLESVGAEYLELYGSKHATMPHLTRLAQEEGIVFDNFYVEIPNSCKSIVSLTASVLPRPDWKMIVRDSPGFNVPTIPQVLTDHGYRTCFLHSGYWSWRNRDNFFRARGVQTLIDAETIPVERVTSWGVSDRAMFMAAIDWIDMKPADPFFMLAYTIETHHPYFAPDAQTFGVEDADLNRYLNALRNADEHIGWLMHQLEVRGLRESTLVVVMGDHGESFGQHGQREHMFGVYEPNVHIPMVLLNPALKDAPRRISAVRQQIDLAPTLVNVLGVDAPEAWQGRNLFRPQQDERIYFCCVGNNVVLGLREGNLKYHFYVETGHEELFDLKNDPKEQRNLASEEPDRCAGFRKRVGGYVQYQREYLAKHGVN